MSLSFEQAAEQVKQLKSKPDNDTLLQLYAHYKQATVGDCSGSQPYAVQFEARAKYDAWNKLKGTSQDSAKQQYINKVQSLLDAEK